MWCKGTAWGRGYRNYSLYVENGLAVIMCVYIRYMYMSLSNDPLATVSYPCPQSPRSFSKLGTRLTVSHLHGFKEVCVMGGEKGVFLRVEKKHSSKVQRRGV